MGLCSVLPRTLTWRDVSLSVGLVGNLIVSKSHRSPFAAVSLIRAVRQLVVDGEIDLLLGVPVARAARVVVGLRFRQLGTWRTYTIVSRSARALRRRFGVAGVPAAPLVDALAWTYQRLRRPAITPCRVDELSATELESASFDGWSSPADRICQRSSPSFLRWRFLDMPVHRYRVLGVYRAGTELNGYAVARVEGDTATIVDSGVNGRSLGQAECILAVVDALGSEAGVVSVRILDRTVLADELRHHGFVARRPDRERTYLVALARDDGPAQDALAEVHRWNLFSGFNDV